MEGRCGFFFLKWEVSTCCKPSEISTAAQLVAELPTYSTPVSTAATIGYVLQFRVL